MIDRDHSSVIQPLSRLSCRTLRATNTPSRLRVKSVSLSLIALMGLSSAFPAQAGLFSGSDSLIAVLGVKGALRDNVLAYVAPLEPMIRSKHVDEPRLIKSVETALSALGYFEPSIEISPLALKNFGSTTSQALLIRIQPGEPVRLKTVDVTITGEGKDFPGFLEVLKKVPAPGSILDQGTYESIKNELNTVALLHGFFNAEFTQHELGVAPDLHEAIWKLTFATGARWHFGETKIVGSELNPELLRVLSPYQVGTPYDASLVSLYNRRLQQTGWFKNAIVAPEGPATSPEHVLPMQANVLMQDKNRLEVGLGVSTDVGVHGKLAWHKPWVNRYGHAFTSTTGLSKPEQTQDFSYKVPIQHAPLTDYWLYQFGGRHANLNDTQQSTLMLGVSRYHQTEGLWQVAGKLRYSLNRFTQANAPTERTHLFMPGVSASRTRVRGGINPDWGDTQNYSLDVSAKGLLSDVSFARVMAEVTLLRTYQNTHRFIWRAQGGFIATNQFPEVPPDLRFFAGGANSIRGYGFQKISPRDASGKLTGARLLLTGSIEYQYHLTGNWWGAAFFDIGNAMNSFKGFRSKQGAGIGVRWSSPVGPIKLDIAHPVGHVDPMYKKSWQFYIGLGSTL